MASSAMSRAMRPTVVAVKRLDKVVCLHITVNCGAGKDLATAGASAAASDNVRAGSASVGPRQVDTRRVPPPSSPNTEAAIGQRLRLHRLLLVECQPVAVLSSRLLAWHRGGLGEVDFRAALDGFVCCP